MAAIFPTLIAAIVVVGLVHVIWGHYCDRARQRKKRAAITRLGVGAEDPDQ